MKLTAVNSIFYCVTLGFMSTAVHRHRRAGRPIKATHAWTGEANEMTHTNKTPTASVQPIGGLPPYQPDSVGQAPAQSSYPSPVVGNPPDSMPGGVELVGSQRYS